MLAGLTSATVQYLAGAHQVDTINNDFLPILPMLMFGEGFINDAVMSLMFAYKPRWVATFHDSWHLKDK